MTRQHNDANMRSIGERVVGEGLALNIVNALLAAPVRGPSACDAGGDD
jgi:ribose 5-phosphate isomerase B